MNAAALLTLIQGVISGVPAAGASASAPGTSAPGAAAPGTEPTVFAEALAAALAGQGALPGPPMALSPPPQAGAPEGAEAVSGASGAAPAAAAAATLTLAVNFASSLNGGGTPQPSPATPDASPEAASLPSQAAAAGAAMKTMAGRLVGAPADAAPPVGAPSAAQGFATTAELEPSTATPAASAAHAVATPGAAGRPPAHARSALNRETRPGAVPASGPIPPGLGLGRQVAGVSARLVGGPARGSGPGPADVLDRVAEAMASLPAASPAAASPAAAMPAVASPAVASPPVSIPAVASPAVASPPVSIPAVASPAVASPPGSIPAVASAAIASPTTSGPLAAAAADMNPGLEGQAGALAPGAAIPSAGSPVEGMLARVVGTVTAEAAVNPVPPSPVLAAEPAPAAAPLPAGSGAAVALAEAAPIAAELSASAVSAIAAEPEGIAGAKEAAPSEKSQAEPISADGGEGQTPGAAGPSVQARAGGGGGDQDRSEGRAPLAPDPAPGIDVEEPEPEAILEPAAAEAAIASASAGEGRAAPVVRGAPETVANLAAQIARKLEGRNTRFEIALDPHGLGAVQVSVEINSKGELSAHMSCEKPEAAAELRARSAELQRALEQAGFDLSRGGLHFDNGGGRQRHAEGETGRRAHARAFQDALSTADAADAPPAHPVRFRDHARTGLDLRI